MINTADKADTTEGKGKLKVLVLQASGRPSADSYARLLTPFPTLQTFTVCYRIRLLRFREESTMMSYAVSDDKDNELRMGRLKDRSYSITSMHVQP